MILSKSRAVLGPIDAVAQLPDGLVQFLEARKPSYAGILHQPLRDCQLTLTVNRSQGILP
jgi:hypothetical protein